MTTTTASAEEEIDFRALAAPVWRRKLIIIAMVVIATIATYIYYDRQAPSFRTDTVLYIAGSSDTNSVLLGLAAAPGTDRNVQNQARLLKTDDVAANVAVRLGYRGDPRALLGNISSVFESGQDFLTISAKAPSGQDAAALANAFAAAFIQLRSDEARRSVQQALSIASRQLNKLGRSAQDVAQRAVLQQTISRLQAALSTSSGAVRQLDPAGVPGGVKSPNPKRTALFAFILALALGIGLAFLLDRLDRRLRTLEAIEDAYQVPLVSVIPHSESSLAMDAEGPFVDPNFKEAFRGLHTNVRLLTLDRPIKSMVVASAMPGEGKSTVARNTALIYREWGLRVLLMETDLRRPTLAEALGVEPEFGLTHVLTHVATLSSAVSPVHVTIPDFKTLAAVSRQSPLVADGANGPEADGGALDLLAAGRQPANPQAVLASERMAEVMREATDAYDIVIVDSPPLLAVSDGLPILNLVDATLIVSRVETSMRDAAKRMMDVIARVPQAQILGVVANDIRRSGDASTYGYGYGYGYNDASKSSRAGRGAVERQRASV